MAFVIGLAVLVAIMASNFTPPPAPPPTEPEPTRIEQPAPPKAGHRL